MDNESPFDSIRSLLAEMVCQRLSQEYQLIDHLDVDKYRKMVSSGPASERTGKRFPMAGGGMYMNFDANLRKHKSHDAKEGPGSTSTQHTGVDTSSASDQFYVLSIGHTIHTLGR